MVGTDRLHVPALDNFSPRSRSDSVTQLPASPSWLGCPTIISYVRVGCGLCLPVNCGMYIPDHNRQGCIRREGTSEAALAAVRQAAGGGCQSGWGRLLSVTNAIEPGTWRQGDSGWA